MKEKILKWKRESTKSQKTFVISNPLELTAQSIVGENKEGSNVNEEIDKIAHERLKRYKSVDPGSEHPDIQSQPAIPKKPLKFHIKQLEKLLSGDINPPKKVEDTSDVMLLLDSLRVMESLQSVSWQEPQNEPVYDVPKRNYDQILDNM